MENSKKRKKILAADKFHVETPINFKNWYLTPLSTIFQLYLGASVLLVEETGVSRENYQTETSH
jgi:hypothetical protein